MCTLKQTRTKVGYHMKIGVLLLQAKKLPEAKREAQNRFFLSRGSSKGKCPAVTLISDFQNYEAIKFCHLSHLFVVLCYGSPGKLMHEGKNYFQPHQPKQSKPNQAKSEKTILLSTIFHFFFSCFFSISPLGECILLA